MRDHGSALDGFVALYDASGNADAVVPMTVATKCLLDWDLLELCQRHGARPNRGDPLGTLPELWPFDMVKGQLLNQAREFRSQIGKKGYEALTDVYAFNVWGPYMEKVGEIRPWVPEADNPFVAEKRTAQRVWGYEGDEFNFDKGCVYQIVGKFLRRASEGHIGEEDGVIYVS